MSHVIDRRKNPTGKSLDNRQRFIKRVKENLKKIVKESIKNRKISDLDSEEKVNIPVKDISEPVFRNSRIGGNKSYIHPGNKEYSEGDQIQKPSDSGGKGLGSKGSTDPSIFDDDFQFTLTREEFLDIFFEDLELPDLVKKDLKELKNWKFQRAGFTNAGSPNNINIERSLKQSLGRRIALKRPKKDYIEDLSFQIQELKEKEFLNEDEFKKLESLQLEMDRLVRKSRAVPFIDPIDIRYNLFVPKPEPNTKAVMFCIMDVSGSMGEKEKDIAKRFFMLLHLFLTRRYEKIDLVFIRHHTQAKECNEDEFFYSTESGGTIISTSLDLMARIIKERYPIGQWNIYAAQASDGDNSQNDSEICLKIMDNDIMPDVQYFAYIEIKVNSGSSYNMFTSSDSIWANYQKLEGKHKNFAMKQVTDSKDVFAVFRELFVKDRTQ